MVWEKYVFLTVWPWVSVLYFGSVVQDLWYFLIISNHLCCCERFSEAGVFPNRWFSEAGWIGGLKLVFKGSWSMHKWEGRVRTPATVLQVFVNQDSGVQTFMLGFCLGVVFSFWSFIPQTPSSCFSKTLHCVVELCLTNDSC